jgi:hypothetical protein
MKDNGVIYESYDPALWFETFPTFTFNTIREDIITQEIKQDLVFAISLSLMIKIKKRIESSLRLVSPPLLAF